MDSIFSRVIRAMKLDAQFYNEAEHDTSLNSEALLIVIVTALAAGFGTFVGKLFGAGIGEALWSTIAALALAVVNYYVWAYLTYFFGTRFFQAQAEPGELLRVIGYASAPRVLSLFGFIPCIGGLISIAGGIWSLAAGFIGVREALDLDSGKTLITVFVGWVIIASVTFFLGAIGLLGVGLAAPILGQ